MANSREAQFQWDFIEAMTAYGCKAGTAGGCDHKGEEASELDLTYYHLIKREEERLRLEMAGEGYGLTPVSDVRSAGKPHDLEKQRLAEIIDRLNDLYGSEVSDDDKLHFANGITDRIERNEVVMAQVCHHAVLDALSDQEKLSMPLLEGFALLIQELFVGRSSRALRAE